MQRLYEHVILSHFANYQQMIILNGPRQVGKTTMCQQLASTSSPYVYLNWDIKEDRQHILAGQRSLATTIGLTNLQAPCTVIFDELHKYKKWKSFLKGFYDAYKKNSHIIITGSQQLSSRQKSGDSLMGRYFPYRVHPLSVAELLTTEIPKQPISPPKKIHQDQFDALWHFGGYPDPFLKQDNRFLNRWQRLRLQQLFREDIRDLTQIHEISQLEILAKLLLEQTGQQINYTNLANKINVTTKTTQKWLATLETFYYCFLIKPWAKNISRSLLKEPKVYLWDWSAIKNQGARVENFVACHLNKAVDFWTDMGFGDYKLHYLRTKDKKEIDFLITENDQPWFLVEVKTSDNRHLSENLYYFQQATGAPHAFQAVMNLDYVDLDCFTRNTPTIVPVKTLLSQLI